MTILTKSSFCSKKPDISQLLLVDGNINDEAKIDVSPNSEGLKGEKLVASVIIKNGQRDRPVATGALSCLFITALLLTGIGVLSGIHIYKQYAKSSVHRLQGWCAVPYSSNADQKLINPQFRVMAIPPGLQVDHDVEVIDTFPRGPGLPDSYLKEMFEIDGNFEKIISEVEGRQTKIVHDFEIYMSGIIGPDRCFVMQLDPDFVMLPSLFIKTIQGDNKFDFTRVRNTKRAVLPALQDLSHAGVAIQKECSEIPTYFLVEQHGIIKKRSAVLPPATFAQFSGKGVQEIDVANMGELLEQEKKFKAV